jgi:hypothetical protein
MPAHAGLIWRHPDNLTDGDAPSLAAIIERRPERAHRQPARPRVRHDAQHRTGVTHRPIGSPLPPPHAYTAFDPYRRRTSADPPVFGMQ